MLLSVKGLGHRIPVVQCDCISGGYRVKEWVIGSLGVQCDCINGGYRIRGGGGQCVCARGVQRQGQKSQGTSGSQIMHRGGHRDLVGGRGSSVRICVKVATNNTPSKCRGLPEWDGENWSMKIGQKIGQVRNWKNWSKENSSTGKLVKRNIGQRIIRLFFILPILLPEKFVVEGCTQHYRLSSRRLNLNEIIKTKRIHLIIFLVQEFSFRLVLNEERRYFLGLGSSLQAPP